MKEFTSSGWKTKTQTHHYGVTLDNDKPTTGVISNNEIVQFLSDETFGPDSIDLGWENFLEDFRAEHGREPTDDENDDFPSDLSGPHLIGDWHRDENGDWGTFDGDAGYSAIVNESTTQVLRSNTTVRAAGCSPCYPGQADIGSTGDMMAYTLPADCFDGEDN